MIVGSVWFSGAAVGVVSGLSFFGSVDTQAFLMFGTRQEPAEFHINDLEVKLVMAIGLGCCALFDRLFAPFGRY